MSQELKSRVSNKASQFRASVIRDMMRLAVEHKAVTLAQGLPDFPCPEQLKEVATEALFNEINQYSITFGDKLLREAIAEKTKKYRGLEVDPETEITVTCGATEAMVVALVALVDPGEEVIVFEPFYENYNAETIMTGAVTRHVTLKPPDWQLDLQELERAFSNKTRAIILNSPHNPTGKVFSKEEMEAIARLCQKWGVIAITDEIYEHILFDRAEHHSIATFPGMRDLTVTLNSMSKTYSITGWRVGWAIAENELTQAIRKVHDFMTVCAPAPLQRASAKALKLLGEDYYAQLASEYELRRACMITMLDEAGFSYFKPQGAYYVFADISKFGFETDIDFTRYLVEKIGVAPVPGSSFLKAPELKNNYVRFCFSRKMETLEAAHKRLLKIQPPKSK